MNRTTEAECPDCSGFHRCDYHEGVRHGKQAAIDDCKYCGSEIERHDLEDGLYLVSCPNCPHSQHHRVGGDDASKCEECRGDGGHQDWCTKAFEEAVEQKIAADNASTPDDEVQLADGYNWMDGRDLVLWTRHKEKFEDVDEFRKAREDYNGTIHEYLEDKAHNARVNSSQKADTDD